MVDMVPIVATNMSAVGYDPETMLMQIQFPNGAVYSYQNIEPETYAAMMESGNPSAYFHSIVKPQRDRYIFTRVS